MIKNKSFVGFSAFLSFVAIAGLCIELYLKLKGTSLCDSATCKAIGEYTRIGEIPLLSLGIQFFCVLGLLLFFYIRSSQKKVLENLIWLFLTGALGFEGVLLGFQFFSVQSFCLVCIAVFFTVAAITIFFSIGTDKFVIGVLAFVACCGGVAGMFVLNATPGVSEQQSGFATVWAQEGYNDETLQASRFTLILSMDCSHCEEVLSTIAKNKMYLNAYDKWGFAFTDIEQEAMEKVALFAQNGDKADTIFSFLLAIKQGQVDSSNPLVRVPESSMRESVQRKNLMTIEYLAAIGLNGVPVLVDQQKEGKMTILLGRDAILKHLGL